MSPTPTTAGPPGRRADARRNRARILAAAAEAFAERDGEVSMAQVARRAGVGMATLYRNFPARRELLEALYAREVDELCRAAGQAVDTGSTPGRALTGWLQRFTLFHHAKHPIAAELLRHTDVADPVFGSSRQRVLDAGRPLLAAAQDAGEVRGALTIEQVLDLVLAAATIPGEPSYVEPILRAVLDGLLAQGAVRLTPSVATAVRPGR